MTRQKAALGLLLTSFFMFTPASIFAQDEGTYKPVAPKTPKPSPKTPSKAPAKTPAPPLREEGKSIFTGPGESKSDKAAGSWCIVIEAFQGSRADADAAAGLAKVRAETAFSDAYLEKRGTNTIIAYGHYADPSSAEAKSDLARIRATQVSVDGTAQKPFASAFLAAPTEINGTLPEFDLNNAKKLSGDWALYTLQIGVYSREDAKPVTAEQLAEFRRTAEQAVIQLRREGEQAFYYHGPNRSMVTIGLFGDEDFDATSKTEGPMITQLRKRFPYNLQNGMGVKHKRIVTDPKTGKQVRQEQLDKSGLVLVPDPEKQKK